MMAVVHRSPMSTRLKVVRSGFNHKNPAQNPALSGMLCTQV